MLATIKQVMEFFDMPIRVFGAEWKLLSKESQTEIKQGIGDGSLTY